MGILGKFGNFLEKSGVSVFSKETLKLLTEMNDQGCLPIIACGS
ncbi:Uncharacterised protein [Klebsiella pneumoniae subsp. ozaenae]|uniref:Uncharacterized protein n=1 Tax=Klebsiella pneumoniae subsp. ozaenae TaxID=574 RepID=A0A377Z8W1_KLEPO|nr:Uncharacterised protein [Klebsiella pneumoniae subsp. ozaenae]